MLKKNFTLISLVHSFKQITRSFVLELKHLNMSLILFSFTTDYIVLYDYFLVSKYCDIFHCIYAISCIFLFCIAQI